MRATDWMRAYAGEISQTGPIKAGTGTSTPCGHPGNVEATPRADIRRRDPTRSRSGAPYKIRTVPPGRATDEMEVKCTGPLSDDRSMHDSKGFWAILHDFIGESLQASSCPDSEEGLLEGLLEALSTPLMAGEGRDICLA